MPVTDRNNSINTGNGFARFIDPARAIGDPTKLSTAMDEDDDDKTVLSGGGTKNDPNLTDISVKWCFTDMSDATAATAALADILTTILQTQFDTTTLIDHKGEEFAMNENKNETQHIEWLKKEFKVPFHKTKVKSANRSTRMYATHRIQSSLTLSTLKSHHLIREKLRQYNAYLNIHYFSLENWDIAHLGFFAGYNVSHTTKLQTKLRLTTEMQTITNDIPLFEIAKTTVRSAPIDGKVSATSAYEIQCARKDSRKLSSIFQKGIFLKTMAFVPYTMKHSHAKGFRVAVHVQNKNSADMWVVKVEGFTPKAMQHLQDVLTTKQGYHAVTPTGRAAEIGEWKIIVHRNHLNKLYD